MSQNFNMIYFKNEILTDIKKIENDFNNRITQITNLIKSNSEEYNSKFTKYSNLITELIEIVSNRKHDYEKIEELFQMKNSIWAHINDQRNKLVIITKDLENAVFKYDRIIIDNLELPGIVGNRCKYKNMRELFEYIYNEIKTEQLFREEQNLGNKKYKEKIEALINNLTLRSSEILQRCSNICVEKLKDFENSINKRCETTEGLLDNLRVENSEYAIELKSKVEKINIDWEKLSNLKNETYDKINEELKKFNKIAEKNNNVFNENKKEFKLIKQKFTQLSDFIRDVRFQKNITGHRRSSVFSKEAKNIDFNKKQEIQKDLYENKNINDLDNSFSINYEKNNSKINESYDLNLIKNKKENNLNNSFVSPRSNNHISSINLTYDKKNISSNKKDDKLSFNNLKIYKKTDIKQKSQINIEIDGNKNNVKNLKKSNNKISIKKEVELNFLADSLNSVSSSSISDKDELYPKTERMMIKKFTFGNFGSSNHLNNDENKNDKLEEKNNNNLEIKLKEEIGKKLKLKSLELMAIENNKNRENNIIKTEEKIRKSNEEIKEYSNKKYIRNNKSHKTDYFNLKGKQLISEFDINSDTNNQTGKKLLLTEITQYKKENDNNSDNDDENKKTLLKTQNSEENKYYDYPKTSRHSSIGTRKISFNVRDNDYLLYSNKKLNIYDNYINKNDENINKIFTKVDFLQNKYIPLIKKINDLFNMIKHLNNKVIENKVSISQLQKNNKDENSNTHTDYNLFLSKTLRKRNNKYSLEIKHNKNKNYIKKMDNFDVSYKKKMPNDQANIILRRIEPFLIKEFTKKNNY